MAKVSRYAAGEPEQLERQGTDIYTPDKRSDLMARVRTRDTAPEISVRSALHRKGLRFRLHRRELPGNPDLVLPRYRTAIFVHGCFWHQHPGCKKATLPKQNAEFWKAKLQRNTERDAEVQNALETLGWRVIIVWECMIRKDITAWANDLVSKLKEVVP